MYKKQLRLDAIIQALFLVPLLLTGLLSLLSLAPFIIFFLISLFFTGVAQLISGLYWGVMKREPLRTRYLIFCGVYIAITILGVALLSNSSYFGGGDVLFIGWVVVLPFCVSVWYWAMTINDARKTDSFLPDQTIHYSDILDQ